VIRMLRRPVERTLTAFAVVALVATGVSAQQVDSARTAARVPNAPAVSRDTARPPISPKRAFLYSLVAPGYGQAVLDRPIAGAMFAGAEMVWIAMATKSAYDLRYARAHKRDSLVLTYAFENGKVKVDSLGNLVGATYAPSRYGPARVAARRKHLEDYYALIIANHLLAGAEAFVAAQLWDLPAHVSIKAMPFGHALAWTIRW
jgi:hypothetical protein